MDFGKFHFGGLARRPPLPFSVASTDCLADDAGLMRTRLHPSDSLINRVNTGNSAILRPNPESGAGKGPMLTGLFRRIPLEIGTGSF
jgi:hypothetical protein